MTRWAVRRPSTFLLLYALAWAGGTIAYVPFLTLLLPAHVGALAGAAQIGWLGTLTFAGAIAASGAHIGFGWLSDVTRRRKPWIVGGLIAMTALLAALGQARSLPQILLLLVLWQTALNAVLGPLSAWAGDRIPDAEKGTLGGFLAFAPAAGALTGMAVTWPGLVAMPLRHGVIAAIVAACILPIVLFGKECPPDPAAAPPAPRRTAPAARAMWLARLLVQVSEAALFAYFYLWFRTLSDANDDASAARLIALVLFTGAPLALLAGRLADARGTPILPLKASALVGAAGLGVMALARAPAVGVAGYVVFGLATSLFLALHSAQTLRVLPRPDRRGRDLGVFNLTNTVPSLVMPGLTVALVPRLGFEALFAVLAGLSLAAFVLLQRAFPRA